MQDDQALTVLEIKDNDRFRAKIHKASNGVLLELFKAEEALYLEHKRGEDMLYATVQRKAYLRAIEQKKFHEERRQMLALLIAQRFAL